MATAEELQPRRHLQNMLQTGREKQQSLRHNQKYVYAQNVNFNNCHRDISSLQVLFLAASLRVLCVELSHSVTNNPHVQVQVSTPHHLLYTHQTHLHMPQPRQ